MVCPTLNDGIHTPRCLAAAQQLEEPFTGRAIPFRDHFHSAVIQIGRGSGKSELQCACSRPPPETYALDVPAHPCGQTNLLHNSPGDSRCAYPGKQALMLARAAVSAGTADNCTTNGS